ncbi:MAG TPA: hypothetical protein VMG81_01520 [Thermoplasmata archaeon]|nr:hypothetical protein [Thermoplasmata archaeon]
MQLSLSAPNQYAVNPPPRGNWFSRHGKTVLEGTAVVGGAVVIAGIAYFVVDSLLGGSQPPACTALQNQLYSLQQQMLAIYQQAAAQGGTFTSSQQSEVQSLQQSIASTVNQMSGVCVASPGQTLETTLDQIISYGLWVAAGVLGLVASAFFIRWAVQRWGGSKPDPGNPPSSPEDVDLPAGFEGGATGGADLANGEIAAEYEAGQITSEEAESAAANLAASDPAIGVASTISDYLTTAAETAGEAAAALLDALAALWATLTDLLSDIYTALLALLGI